MALLDWIWTVFCEIFTQVLKFTGLGYYLQDLIGQADSTDLFTAAKKSLIDAYGPIHFPFFEGSFNEAKKEFIKREEPDLILLVYCHVDNSPYSKQTVKDIICDKDAASHFDQPNIITWMCDVRSNLTYYYLTQKLGYEGIFPAFLLLSEFKGKLRLISSVQAPVTKNQLIDEMNEALSNFEIQRIMEEEGDATGAKRLKSESQLLREDQDAAYQHSLEADRRKREERLAEEEAEKKAKTDAERALTEASLREEQKNKVLEAIKACLPTEPSPNEPGCVTLSIQFPGGKRCTRRFPSKAPVEDVYRFCACECGRLPDHILLKIPLPLLELVDKERKLSEYGMKGSIKLVAELIS